MKQQVSVSQIILLNKILFFIDKNIKVIIDKKWNIYPNNIYTAKIYYEDSSY